MSDIFSVSGGKFHFPANGQEDRKPWTPTVTACGLTVTPLNYFATVADADAHTGGRLENQWLCRKCAAKRKAASVQETGITPRPWFHLSGGNIVTQTGPNWPEHCIARFKNEADAKLFKAAPGMLAALDDCITNENCTAIATCDVAYMIRRFKAINEIARAAIAAAETV